MLQRAVSQLQANHQPNEMIPKSNAQNSMSFQTKLNFQVWEDTFQGLVDGLRCDELSSVRIFLGLQAVQGFLWNCAVFIIAFASFSVYALYTSLDVQVSLGNFTHLIVKTLVQIFSPFLKCLFTFCTSSNAKSSL